MKRVTVVLVLVALLLGLALPAMAGQPDVPDPGPEFGQHHSLHAREMGGFTGEMNPGMHQGKSDWGACACE